MDTAAPTTSVRVRRPPADIAGGAPPAAESERLAGSRGRQSGAVPPVRSDAGASSRASWGRPAPPSQPEGAQSPLNAVPRGRRRGGLGAPSRRDPTTGHRDPSRERRRSPANAMESTAPRGCITRPRGGRGVAGVLMGDPSLAVRDRRSRSKCCESALDAFTLADPCGGCGVSVVRQGPQARFRRVAYASVAVHPHGQRVIHPRPRLQRHAPRLGGFINPGGFPGRRVATRTRAAAASPFGLSEPASG